MFVAGPGRSGERSCSPYARAGGPGMREARGSPFRAALGEREAQNPRKLDDEIRERPDGHEFEKAPGVGDGQGSLACCSSRGCKELDMIERLN